MALSSFNIVSVIVILVSLSVVTATLTSSDLSDVSGHFVHVSFESQKLPTQSTPQSTSQSNHHFPLLTTSLLHSLLAGHSDALIHTMLPWCGKSKSLHKTLEKIQSSFEECKTETTVSSKTCLWSNIPNEWSHFGIDPTLASSLPHSTDETSMHDASTTSTLRFYSLDASSNEGLKHSLQIHSIPSIILIRCGYVVYYDGERQYDAISNWMRRILLTNLKILKNIDDIEDFISSDIESITLAFIPDVDGLNDRSRPPLRSISVADSAESDLLRTAMTLQSRYDAHAVAFGIVYVNQTCLNVLKNIHTNHYSETLISTSSDPSSSSSTSSPRDLSFETLSGVHQCSSVIRFLEQLICHIFPMECDTTIQETLSLQHLLHLFPPPPSLLTLAGGNDAHWTSAWRRRGPNAIVDVIKYLDGVMTPIVREVHSSNFQSILLGLGSISRGGGPIPIDSPYIPLSPLTIAKRINETRHDGGRLCGDGGLKPTVMLLLNGAVNDSQQDMLQHFRFIANKYVLTSSNCRAPVLRFVYLNGRYYSKFILKFGIDINKNPLPRVVVVDYEQGMFYYCHNIQPWQTSSSFSRELTHCLSLFLLQQLAPSVLEAPSVPSDTLVDINIPDMSHPQNQHLPTIVTACIGLHITVAITTDESVSPLSPPSPSSSLQWMLRDSPIGYTSGRDVLVLFTLPTTQCAFSAHMDMVLRLILTQLTAVESFHSSLFTLLIHDVSKYGLPIQITDNVSIKSGNGIQHVIDYINISMAITSVPDLVLFPAYGKPSDAKVFRLWLRTSPDDETPPPSVFPSGGLVSLPLVWEFLRQGFVAVTLPPLSSS